MEICIRLKDDQPLRFIIEETDLEAEVYIFDVDDDEVERLIGKTTVKELRNAVSALAGVLWLHWKLV